MKSIDYLKWARQKAALSPYEKYQDILFQSKDLFGRPETYRVQMCDPIFRIIAEEKTRIRADLIELTGEYP